MTVTPWPIQRDIRSSMAFSAIVDINGVMNPKTGGFHVVQDALDAKHKFIFVRNGTYPGCIVYQNNTVIVGESWDAILDGAAASHGCRVNTGVTGVHVSNLQAKTTAGGGSSYHAFSCGAGSEPFHVDHCYVPESDYYGIAFEARGRAECCTVTGCDQDGINCASNANDTIITGCYIYSNGNWGTADEATCENIVVVGNRVTGNTAGQVRQASGTGTYAGNDET